MTILPNTRDQIKNLASCVHPEESELQRALTAPYHRSQAHHFKVEIWPLLPYRSMLNLVQSVGQLDQRIDTFIYLG